MVGCVSCRGGDRHGSVRVCISACSCAVLKRWEGRLGQLLYRSEVPMHGVIPAAELCLWPGLNRTASGWDIMNSLTPAASRISSILFSSCQLSLAFLMIHSTFVFFIFSFTTIFLLIHIFLSKQCVLLHRLRDSYAGVASEWTWPAGKLSAEIVVDGGMRCCSFFLLVAGVSLKVFAGLIVSGKKSKCFCGMARGLFVEIEYSTHFFHLPSSVALYTCEVVFIKFLVFLYTSEDCLIYSGISHQFC